MMSGVGSDDPTPSEAMQLIDQADLSQRIVEGGAPVPTEPSDRLQIGLPPLFRIRLGGEPGVLDGRDLSLANSRLPTFKAFVRTTLLPYQETADDEMCSICLEKPEPKISLKCGHYYCHACICVWVATQELGTCPVCRQMLYIPHTQVGIEIDPDALRLRRSLQSGCKDPTAILYVIRLAGSTVQEVECALKRAYNELDAPSRALARGTEVLDWAELETDFLAMGVLLMFARPAYHAVHSWSQIMLRLLKELRSGWRSRYSLHRLLSTPGALGSSILEALDLDAKELDAMYTDVDGTRCRGLRPGIDPFETRYDEQASPALFDWRYTRLTDYLALLATR